MQTLIQGLRDGRASVRAESALALGSMGGEAVEAAGWLAVVVRDTEPEVRRAAVEALVAMQVDELPFVVDALARALDDTDEDVRRVAEQAVLDVGKAGVASLMRALNCPAPKAMRRLVPTLLRREDALDLFVEAGRHPLVTVRINGALGLFQLALNGVQEAEPWLERAKQDEVAEVRRAADNAVASLASGAGPPAVLDTAPVDIEGFEEGVLSVADLQGHEVPVSRLVEALSDGRRRIRLNAVRALHAMGTSGVAAEEPLRRALKDSEPKIRRAARDALAALGRPVTEAVVERVGVEAPAAPQVREALQPGVEGFDHRLLGAAELKGVALTPAELASLLDDGRSMVRVNAASALRLRGQGSDEVVTALASRLRDVDATVRRVVVGALVASGRAAERGADLVRMLRDDEDPACRASAAEALALDGDALLGGMEGDATFVQGALMPLILDRSDATELLAGAATQPHVSTRVNAALGAYRQGDVAALEALREDPVMEVRQVALAALRGLAAGISDPDPIGLVPGLLGRWRPPGAPASPAIAPEPTRVVGLPGVADAAPRELAILLRDSDPGVRAQAADAIGSGPASKDVVAVAGLARAVNDTEGRVRDAARDAVLRADPDALRAALAVGGASFAEALVVRTDALALLLSATESDVSPVRRGAVRALGAVRREDATAARERLVELRGSSDGEVVDGVAASLAQLGRRHRPAATLLVEKTLPLEGWADSPLGAAALKAAAAATGLDRLVAILRDGRALVRVNAARSLGFLGRAEGRGAVPPLLLALKDSDQGVRAAAAEAIGRLKPPVDVAVPALLRALATPTAAVVEALDVALRRFGDAGVRVAVEALATPSAEVVEAVEGLARSRHVEFVGPLADALAADSSVMRCRAADALASMGPHARQAEARLVACIDDADHAVRVSAVRALGRLGDVDEKVVFRLMDIVRANRDVSLVIAAKEAFRYLGMGWRIPG